MGAEQLDRGGMPTLRRGFWGGSFAETPTALPPSELLNPGDAKDRQKIFYWGIAELGDFDTAYMNYWRPGGGMSSLMSEFSVAFENARVRAGVVVPEEVQRAYEERIVAYMSCMGLASGIMHCDGTMALLAEQIIPQEHEDSKWWNETKASMMMNDPAIEFAVDWVRQYAESGTLPRFWERQKVGDAKAVAEFIDKMAAGLEASSRWTSFKALQNIPDGIERPVTKIALAYFIAEDLPAYQRDIAAGRVVFSDPAAPSPDADKSDCGFLPFDNVFYATLSNPTGILNAKGVFPNDPEIVRDIAAFFNYADHHFVGQIADKHPSKITVKDMKRFSKVWDLLIGGSQGMSLTDFTKFGEAIAALCNLYNNRDLAQRANVVGWMVGEAFYFKTRALMVAADTGVLDQLFRVVSLGDEDTPQELDRVTAGVLGSQGLGFYGARQVARQFGLKIGTEHYNQAVAMIKTGVNNPKLAQFAQKGLVVASAINRFGGFGGGKKKR